MANIENSITAHMDINGERYEILVDPDLAYMYRVGQKKEINNVLTIEEVFKAMAAAQQAFAGLTLSRIGDLGVELKPQTAHQPSV